ncbi:juvenile hormone acid O-methyltransferase-like [Stomoxys calcitrans]|uniref:juvenile hormone acid O-methyltransferase-like n=1 Tax=Stomoxys calcitrans TaxID=35570 RepID=UPI0027E23AD2|nr:juvenile hormone acid O-methyltransferase-like [Stomoxys calcitrans]
MWALGQEIFFISHIYPLVKEKCSKIVLCDISKEMLEYCRKHFHVSDKLDYKLFDIAEKSGPPKELEGQFDHVTSMLVLHWVSDYRQSLKNFYQLLRPKGGDCILSFFFDNHVFHTCNHLGSSPKWFQYTQGKGQFHLEFLNSKDPITDFCNMMTAEGFQNVEVKMKPVVYNYGNKENFKENMISVLHIFDFLTKAQQDEFFDEFVDHLAQLAAKKLGTSPQNSKYCICIDLVVAYGQKPCVIE